MSKSNGFSLFWPVSLVVLFSYLFLGGLSISSIFSSFLFAKFQAVSKVAEFENGVQRFW